MRANTSIGLGAVGALDSIHILTNWTTAVIPPDAPTWIILYAAYLATGVLAAATWFVLPTVLHWLAVMVDTSRTVHSWINRMLLCSILGIVRITAAALGAVETYLSDLPHKPSS